MKQKMIIIVSLFIYCFSISIFARESQEKIYLVQMINQLEALKSLVIAAAKEQPANLRIQFHYIAYRDASNQLNNGLFEDIDEIEKGVKAKLNHLSFEPHRFELIKGDYVNNQK